MRSEILLRGLSPHRALRDWPEGRFTPRLRRVTARASRCWGGGPECPRAARGPAF